MRQGRPAIYPFNLLELNETFTIPASMAPKIQRFKAYVQGRNYMLRPKKFSAFQNLDGSITVTRRS